jgi:hypothetical protein
MQIDQPWPHWIQDDFLSAECLAELKAIPSELPQTIAGRRNGSERFFVDETNQYQYPHLYQLYMSLKQGQYKAFFESATGLDYTGLHPRVEVISDIGDFSLEPHLDHVEKRLSALVYTDHAQLWPGTGFANGTRVESRDNRCFFFVAGPDTLHDYPRTHFDQVRRCLQINYWTYKKESPY